MKKIILFLALCAIGIQSFAGGPTTRELAAADNAIKDDIEAIKVALESDSARNAFIDELQVKFTEGKAVATEPVESQEDMIMLLGVLLGILTYFLNNILYKIKGVQAWVEYKFSKTGVTIVLGVLATAVAVLLARVNGDASWQESLIWLVSAWGTHFGIFFSRVQK
jgi:hypothetical protein